jgi:anaerobic magnesium-protoporphyrin IX monomethyl ester cyclase
MRAVDVVFIKPGSQRQLYGELSSFQLTAIEPPLWAALLASYLREKGYSIALFDAEVENWSHEETARRIKELNPLLAAIVVSGTNPSASTMNMVGAGAILRHLKEQSPAIRTCLTGLHPSALPERTLREETLDFVCQGEGFYTLPQLIDALKAGEDEFSIQGLWYRRNGNVFGNPRAALMENLDELPMPAWDLLPIPEYRAHNWHCFENIEARQPYAVIYTSLGCPFRCGFCCINALFGKPGIRYRSPDVVIQEIDYLVRNFGVRNIKILDEMFVLNPAHVTRLCDLIIKRGYDLNIWAYARVNTVNRDLLRRMRRAGVRWLAYGFESGSDEVLKGVTKGYSLGSALEVARMTREEGIYICSNFIFGLPDDDLESMKRTLDLALEINGEWANLYSAMAYPGSRLYEQALEEGWPLPESWQGYSQYAYESRPLPTKHLGSAEVLRFRDRAFQTYYSNPGYLDRISRTFSAETSRHIREMASHNLKRRNA